MKKLIMTALTMVVSQALALGQSEFDGTWKIDLSKASLPNEADVFLLQNGIYHCKTCVPKIDVKADGQDQSVIGDPYFDTINIKVLDDRTIEEIAKTEWENREDFKADGLSRWRNGNPRFHRQYSDDCRPDYRQADLYQTPEAKRPPAGAHAISGFWNTTKMADFSNNALTFTYKLDGDSLTMTNLSGQSFTAKLDGTEVPYKGDLRIDQVSVLRVGAHAFVETDKPAGKTVRTTRVMFLPGADKTVNLIAMDNTRGTSTLFVAERQ